MGETNAGTAQLQPDIHFSLMDIISAEVLRAVRRERRIAISIGPRNLESFHRPVVGCALRPGASIVTADLGNELSSQCSGRLRDVIDELRIPETVQFIFRAVP